MASPLFFFFNTYLTHSVMGKTKRKSSEPARLYCCGEAYDDSKFYLGCSAEDACIGDEWYHGTCLNPPITAASAGKIKDWYCGKCRDAASAEPNAKRRKVKTRESSGGTENTENTEITETTEDGERGGRAEGTGDEPCGDDVDPSWTEEALMKMKVGDLKDLLKKKNLPIGGNKTALVARCISGEKEEKSTTQKVNEQLPEDLRRNFWEEGTTVGEVLKAQPKLAASLLGCGLGAELDRNSNEDIVAALDAIQATFLQPRSNPGVNFILGAGSIYHRTRKDVIHDMVLCNLLSFQAHQKPENTKDELLTRLKTVIDVARHHRPDCDIAQAFTKSNTQALSNCITQISNGTYMCEDDSCPCATTLDIAKDGRLVSHALTTRTTLNTVANPDTGKPISRQMSECSSAVNKAITATRRSCPELCFCVAVDCRKNHIPFCLPPTQISLSKQTPLSNSNMQVVQVVEVAPSSSLTTPARSKSSVSTPSVPASPEPSSLQSPFSAFFHSHLATLQRVWSEYKTKPSGDLVKKHAQAFVANINGIVDALSYLLPATALGTDTEPAFVG